jgi:hypothetical protein
MAAPYVKFIGTRVNDSDTNTNWNKLDAGGAAPNAESEIKYQGTNVVNIKVNNTTLPHQGVEYFPSGTTQSLLTGSKFGNNHLWFVKAVDIYSFDLNAANGALICVGSSDVDRYNYIVAGTDAKITQYESWPVTGGYKIFAVNPNESFWVHETDGTPAFNAVDFYGFGSYYISGAAKSENLGLDAIDIGRGLSIEQGDATQNANFANLVFFDQTTVNNRYGVIQGDGNAVTAHGMIYIGDSIGSNTTYFSDTDSIVTFPNAYIQANNVGVTVQNSVASCTYDINNLYISAGQANTILTNDTRANFQVYGTSSTVNFGGSIRNFKDITLNSSCVVSGADIEAETIFPSDNGTSSISGSIIRTNATANNATIQDFPASGSTAINDIEFIQTGVGQAVECSAVGGTYQFTNLTFTGYNAANNQPDSAVHVSATSGTTTINLTGTNEPSVLTEGATVVFASTVTVNVINTLANTEVRVYAGGSEVAGVEDISLAYDRQPANTQIGYDATTDRYEINFSTSAGNDLQIKAFNIALVEGQYWLQDRISYTTTSDSNQTVQLSQRPDRVFSNQ